MFELIELLKCTSLHFLTFQDWHFFLLLFQATDFPVFISIFVLFLLLAGSHDEHITSEVHAND